MDKYVAITHHPLFDENEDTLDFGEDYNVKVLTDDQKVSAFISKYMETIDPFIVYKDYFTSSAKSNDHIMRDVKMYYKKLVVQGTWTERKYVMVINDIFENRMVMNIMTLDRAGMMYEKELLASQKRLKKISNRRRR